MRKRRLLKATEVAERLGMSKTWVFEHSVYADEPSIPMPIDLGTEGAPVYRWHEGEVEAHLDRKTRERDERAKGLRRTLRAAG